MVVFVAGVMVFRLMAGIVVACRLPLFIFIVGGGGVVFMVVLW